MAVSHIAFNAGTSHGALLRRSLNSLESGLDDLTDTLAVMARMIDGDGSDAAHFTYMQDKYGFASNEAAKSAFEELNSLAFKLTTNAQVSDVAAAIAQALAKFR